jgi:hypothetical protein
VTFPTIPTAAAGRILTTVQADASGTRTFPNLSNLTKSAGDLLIAIIVAYEDSQTDAAFSGWGAGFTEFHDSSAAGAMAIGAAYKWSTGSETGTFTVTQAATVTGHAVMFLMAISGAHASTPPAAGGRASGTNTFCSANGVNPTAWDIEDTLWLAVGGCGETSLSGSFTGISGVTPPANYVDQVTSSLSGDVVGALNAAVCFRQLAVALDDPGNFDNDTTSARWCAVSIGVRPAPAAAGSTVAAATGSLTLNPVSVTPTPGRVFVTASVGTLTLTPVPVTLPSRVTVTPGNLTLQPVHIGRRWVAATVGTLTLTPVAVTPVKMPSVVGVPDRWVELPGVAGAYGQINNQFLMNAGTLDADAYVSLAGNLHASDEAGPMLTTPHHADYNFTGDIDWRIEVDLLGASPNMHAATLFSKNVWDGVNDAWNAYFTVDGTLYLRYQTSGGTFYTPGFAGVWVPGRRAMRFTIDVDDGAGHHVIRYYTANRIDDAWTLQDTITAGAGTNFTGFKTNTLDIAVGGFPTPGGPTYGALRANVYAFEMREGIDGTVRCQLRAKNYAPERSYDPAANGYSLVYSEDFNGGPGIPSDWTDHFPWFLAPPAGDASVANSVLRLKTLTAMGDMRTEVVRMGTSGTPYDYDFQEGFFECRMRYSDSPWAWPAFWLLSTDWIALYPNFATLGCPNGYRNIEFDIFDGGGREFVNSGMHRNTSDPCSEPDTQRVWLSPPPSGRGDDWHVYAGRWTATHAYTYIDGQLSGVAPVYDTWTRPMTIICTIQMFSENVLTDILGLSPPPPKPTELWAEFDWVKVWQR